MKLSLSQPTNQTLIKNEVSKFFKTIDPSIPILTETTNSYNVLQAGKFGQTYLSADKTNVVKVINLQPYLSEPASIVPIIIERMTSEVINYHKISEVCPEFFCKFIGYHYDPTEFYVAIKMEYCGKDLIEYYNEDILKNNNNKQHLKNILLQIAKALQCLHTNGYVHFDLKPDNITVSADGTVKLIDAGSLTKINDEQGIVCGTADYMAPELVGKLSVPKNNELKKTDIYSYGILVKNIYANVFNETYLNYILNERPPIEKIISILENNDNNIFNFLGGNKITRRRRYQKRSVRR